MNARGVLREAWRNIITGTARTGSVTVAAILLALLFASADMWSIHQLEERAEQFRNSGGSVLILAAAGRVDGQRCDRLAELEGVRAAGALRETDLQIAAAVLPRSPLPVREASPGFVVVIRASAVSAGVLLGPEASEVFGTSGGDTIATTTEDARVGGTYPYPDDGRRPGLSYAAIATTPDSRAFDECWVDTWPTKDMSSALLTTVRLARDHDDPPKLTQLNGTLGVSFDGKRLFEDRITRFDGFAAAIAGLTLGFAGIRARRLAIASALHAGVTRRAVQAIVTVETLTWIGVSAVLVVPALVVIAAALGEGTTATLTAGIASAVPLWIGGLAGAWIGAGGIKERYLFRYFTTR